MVEQSRPRLSVVVTSFNSPTILRLCLASLVRQPEIDEIVASDCSPANPADSLQRDFPGVRFLHARSTLRVPELRWAALPHMTGEIIGALEARAVPAADWAKLILEEHRAHPDAPAAGGPVALGPSASAYDLALYWCEYGACAPPLRSGPALTLSGANLSYKRAALDEQKDLLQAGAWETLLHERWRVEGRDLRLCQAAVVFHNGMTPPAALRQRFHYGRGYAAARSAQWSRAGRLLYATLAVFLPLLLTARNLRQAAAKGRSRSLVPAMGWLLALNVAWSAGESVGYALGPDPQPRIF